MENLPLELIRHIKSFVFITSWRSTLHFTKLYECYRSIRFHTLPLREISTITEFANRYTYKNYVGENRTVYKSDTDTLDEMKMLYTDKYKEPLHEYLTKYRIYTMHDAWHPEVSIGLCGFDVNGYIYPFMYAFLLKEQAKDEGCTDLQKWHGCITKQAFQKTCFHLIHTRL